MTHTIGSSDVAAILGLSPWSSPMQAWARLTGLVERYDRIYVEALNIVGLTRGMLSRQVSDAAWGGFLHWLRVKAEEAGRDVVEVDPRGASQVCSSCETVVEKPLRERVHRCPHCGLVLDRDVNAARNVLRLGRSLRGAAPLVEGRRRSAKVESSAVDRSTTVPVEGV